MCVNASPSKDEDGHGLCDFNGWGRVDSGRCCHFETTRGMKFHSGRIIQPGRCVPYFGLRVIHNFLFLFGNGCSLEFMRPPAVVGYVIQYLWSVSYNIKEGGEESTSSAISQDERQMSTSEMRKTKVFGILATLNLNFFSWSLTWVNLSNFCLQMTTVVFLSSLFFHYYLCLELLHRVVRLILRSRFNFIILIMKRLQAPLAPVSLTRGWHSCLLGLWGWTRSRSVG